MEDKEDNYNNPVNIRVHHSEIQTDLLEQIANIVDKSLDNNRLDKDACFEAAKKLKGNEVFEKMGEIIRSR